ncbi:MAG TPA: LCP family protein [Candidatus Mediterraneibacter pullistercoris]|nr:LCP family protein [Candidatus Mediterraneibacter pullistercoris]
MGKVKKVLFIIFFVLLALIIGIIGVFFYLRAKGERALKENPVTAYSDSSEGSGTTEPYITYKGKKYVYNDDIINILCLGIDKDLPIEEKRASGSEGLADAVVLISINPEDGSIGVLGIPRDTVVPVKVLDTDGNFVRDENVQITLQYAYGRTAEQSCELMSSAVSNLLYRLPIHRYCSINFQAVPVLNDAVGGVEVEVLEDIDGKHCKLEAGTTVHLDGYEALDYIQDRDTSVSKSSMGRMERQKQYMMNYFARAKEVIVGDPGLPISVYKELEGNMCTNITVEDLAYLVPEVIGISLDGNSIAEIPGEVTQPDENEEFHVDEEALKELVIERFYKEAETTETEGDAN